MSEILCPRLLRIAANLFFRSQNLLLSLEDLEVDFFFVAVMAAMFFGSFNDFFNEEKIPPTPTPDNE